MPSTSLAVSLSESEPQLRREERRAAGGEVHPAAAPRPARAHLPVGEQAPDSRGAHAGAGHALLPAQETALPGTDAAHDEANTECTIIEMCARAEGRDSHNSLFINLHK